MLENIFVLICVTFTRFHWLPLSTPWGPNFLWGTILPSASSLFPGRVLDPPKLKNPITLQPGWPVQTVGDSPAASVSHFSADWASQIVGQVMSEGEQKLNKKILPTMNSGARNAAWGSCGQSTAPTADITAGSAGRPATAQAAVLHCACAE